MRSPLFGTKRITANDYRDLADPLAKIALRTTYDPAMACPVRANHLVKMYWDAIPHGDKTMIFRAWADENQAALEELTQSRLIIARDSVPPDESVLVREYGKANDLARDLEVRFEELAKTYQNLLSRL